MNYAADVSPGIKLNASLDANYSAAYWTNSTSPAAGRQMSCWLLDGSISMKADTGFEVALIGRNLTNKFITQRTQDTPGTGGDAGGLTGALADTQGVVARGREVMIPLGFQF